MNVAYHVVKAEPYDEDYFERGQELGISCYTRYRWLPEATIPLAATLCEQLGIPEGTRILDFGCAHGFLVKALRLLRRDAWGMDISSYALACAHADVKPYLHDARTTLPRGFAWVFAKDVLEHVEERDIVPVLSVLRHAATKIWAAIPLGIDGRYVIPAYENDVTHRIRKPIGWWRERFAEAGFEIESSRYRMEHVKEAWSDWPEGNAFIVAR